MRQQILICCIQPFTNTGANNIVTGAVASMRFVFTNPTITVYCNGVQVFQINDPNFWSGTIGEYTLEPLQTTVFSALDNVILESPVIGTYASTGTIQH